MTKYYDQAYKVYDQLLEGSNFAQAPWTIVNGEDRRAANIQIAQALVDALEHALAGELLARVPGDTVMVLIDDAKMGCPKYR